VGGVHKSFADTYVPCDLCFMGLKTEASHVPKNLYFTEGTRGGSQLLNDSKHDFIMYMNFGVKVVFLSLKPVGSQSQSL
jgi:hypothetical protein